MNRARIANGMAGRASNAPMSGMTNMSATEATFAANVAQPLRQPL
jgi:hypothetical protein